MKIINNNEEQTRDIPERPEEPIDITPTDIEELKNHLKTALTEIAEPLPVIDFTRDNYENLFPRSRIETPIENVKIGAHQFEKLEAKNRQRLLGAVYETLALPDIVINEERKNIFGEQEQVHSYLKSYIINEKTRAIQSVIVSIEDDNVSISTHERDINNAVNKIKTPDQLLFAAAEVGRVITQHTQVNLEQSVSNRTGESSNVDITKPLNSHYNAESVLSIEELIRQDKLTATSEQAKEQENETSVPAENVISDKNPDSISAEQNKFDYMLLSRLQQDCEYYLGNGGKSQNNLWANNELEQISKMAELYNKVSEKPEWLSIEQLEYYSMGLTGKTLSENGFELQGSNLLKNKELSKESEKELQEDVFDSISSETETKELQNAFKAALEETAVPLTEIELSQKNYTTLFARNGIETPVESVKLGNNQFEKLRKSDRDYLLAAAYETLAKPSIVLEKETLDEKTGDFRPVHVYGKSFYRENSDKTRTVESVIIFHDGLNISIGTHNKEISRFVKQIKTADDIIYADKEVSRVASLALESGGNHVRLDGINTEVLNKGYTASSILSIFEKEVETDTSHPENTERLTLDEYLGLKGVTSEISDFMLDKMRFPHGLTERAEKRLQTEADTARQEYHKKRESAIWEYRRKVEEGLIIPKTDLEVSLDRAHGHPDNESTQAARRRLAKKGIDWQSGEKIRDTSISSLREKGHSSFVEKNYREETEREENTVQPVAAEKSENLTEQSEVSEGTVDIDDAQHDIGRDKKNYVFVPVVGEDGIIDYTGVHADQIYLANKKDILAHELPSYLPPVEIRRKGHYDIPAVKVGDNEYLLKGKSVVSNRFMDDLSRQKLETEHFNENVYRVSLDVYAALINYHLEYDRAAYKAIAAHNEQLRKEAQRQGQPRFKMIDECDVPLIPRALDIEQLPVTKNVRMFDHECKPSRVVLQSAKSSRMNWEPYYFIDAQLKSMDVKVSRVNVFAHHRTCLADVQQKLLDMELQKADWETSWTKGRETSYGDSNIDMSLMKRYGVPVKRQNGDAIDEREKAELSTVLDAVYSIYGDLSAPAKEFGLKVSHAGNTRMHASKAIGVFNPYWKAIGISFEGGKTEAIRTAVHEAGHFVDHIIGQKQHANYASDIPGSLENRIATAFRSHMESVKGDYWHRTCECFARAMEEYSQISSTTPETFRIPGYVEYESFCTHIKPLASELIEKNRTELNLNHDKTQNEEPVKKSEAVQNERIFTDRNLDPLQGQLELFENAAEYNSVQHDFFRQIDEYLNHKRAPKNNEFILKHTPDILRYAGVPNHQIIISTGIINKARKVHSLTDGDIRSVLKRLADPILIFDTDKEKSEAFGNNNILLLTDIITKDNKPIAIALKIDTIQDKTNLIVNEIRSIHDRTLIAKNGTNVLEEWTNKGLLKYVDDKKISEWSESTRVYFPGSISQSDNQSISGNTDSVKTKTGYLDFVIAEHPDTYLTSGDPAVTRDHIRQAKMAARMYCDPILNGTDDGQKCGLWKSFRDFRQHGVFDITGKSVDVDTAGNISADGWSQMAQALRIYRDKRFETFRYLFVAPDGTVKDQLAISAHLPNKTFVTISGKQIVEHVIAHAERTGTKIVLVHNHPSGNTNPSIEDMDTTKELERLFTGNDGKCLLQGHVILDHDTFGLYERGSKWIQVTGTVTGRDELEKVRQPDFATVKITDSRTLEKAARSINASDRWNCTDWVPVAFTNGSGHISSIQYYRKDWFVKSNSQDIVQEFRNVASETGAIWAFPVVPDELTLDVPLQEAVHSHMKNGCFRDYYMDGKTAETEGLADYAKDIFNSSDSVYSRAAADATFDISGEPDFSDIDVSISNVAEREVEYNKERKTMAGVHDNDSIGKSFLTDESFTGERNLFLIENFRKQCIDQGLTSQDEDFWVISERQAHLADTKLKENQPRQAIYVPTGIIDENEKPTFTEVDYYHISAVEDMEKLLTFKAQQKNFQADQMSETMVTVDRNSVESGTTAESLTNREMKYEATGTERINAWVNVLQQTKDNERPFYALPESTVQKRSLHEQQTDVFYGERNTNEETNVSPEYGDFEFDVKSALGQFIEDINKNPLQAIKTNAENIRYVKEQTPQLCQAAVRNGEWNFRYVTQQTEENCLAAAKENGLILPYVKEPFPELQYIAVSQNGWVLKELVNPNEKECLAAVSQNGLALQFVKNQTTEICEAAVRDYGTALRFVQAQTPAIRMAAVAQDYEALQYVDKQSVELCVAALHENKDAWKFVDEKLREQVHAAIAEEAKQKRAEPLVDSQSIQSAAGERKDRGVGERFTSDTPVWQPKTGSYMEYVAEVLNMGHRTGKAPYLKSWQPGELQAQYNPATGQIYDAVLYGTHRELINSSDNRWLTADQIRQLGFKISENAVPAFVASCKSENGQTVRHLRKLYNGRDVIGLPDEIPQRTESIVNRLITPVKSKNADYGLSNVFKAFRTAVQDGSGFNAVSIRIGKNIAPEKAVRILEDRKSFKRQSQTPVGRNRTEERGGSVEIA